MTKIPLFECSINFDKLLQILADIHYMLYLIDYLRNPTLSIDVFKCYLKTFLFAQY